MHACSKKTYPTAIAAALALRAIRRGSPHRDERALYRCARCRQFHLTSDTASVSNRWMQKLPPDLLWTS